MISSPKEQRAFQDKKVETIQNYRDIIVFLAFNHITTETPKRKVPKSHLRETKEGKQDYRTTIKRYKDMENTCIYTRRIISIHRNRHEPSFLTQR